MDANGWGGVIRHFSTSSAVNPTLVATIVCAVLGVPGIMFGPAAAQSIFTALIFAPLVVFLAQVVLFSLVDRDRLQNDRHVEQKMMITHKIGYMRDGEPAEMVLPKGELLTENPQLEGPRA